MLDENKKAIKVLLFPWAGGTSRIYSALCNDVAKAIVPATEACPVVDPINTGAAANEIDSIILMRQFRLEMCPVDLPGRLIRPCNNGEEIITDAPLLARQMIQEIFWGRDGKKTNQVVLEGEQYVLFGHSFGAIIAFEIAKLVGEHGIQAPLALFISASRPPSAPSLASSTNSGKPVSEMNFEEMKEYFQSRGASINSFHGLSKDFEELLSNSIRADYKCLETYQSNQNVVGCPLYVFGGSNDCIVSIQDIEKWKNHTSSDLFDCHVLHGKGHFFLDEVKVTKVMSEIIILNIERTLMSANRDAIDTIKTIYAKVLQLDINQLTLDSDFFECGGSSLDTIVLISQIKAHMDVHITQNEFFLNPKVAELAMRVNAIKKCSVVAPKLEEVQGTVAEEGNEQWFPASPGQEQMLSCWEMAPVMYNMPTTIEFFNSPVNLTKMHQAFQYIVEQQPSLRTIVKIDSKSLAVKQRVLPLSQVRECFELKACKARDDEEAICIIEKESLFEFNPSHPPIVRGVLVEITDSLKSYLLLNQHHVGSDGWSRTALRHQLLQAYVGLCSFEDRIPEYLTIPLHPNYVDWTLWLEKWLNDYGEQEKQLNYWKNKLADLPVLNLPTDKPRPAVLSSRGLRIPISIDKILVEQFTLLVSHHGANLYAGLIALYMLMLHRIGGGNDFAIGIALANRHHEGLQNLIGYFANEVAIRAQFQEQMRFEDLLALVRSNILEGMANADVPFHKVTEALHIKRDSSRTSVFQAMFALQERNWHSLDDLCPEEGNIRFQLKNQNHNTSKFEVHLQLRHDGTGGLEGDLHICTDIFTKESGQRMAQMYKNLVRSCVECPSHTICELSMMTHADNELVIECNSTDQIYEKASILDFNASPDDVAFVIETSSMQQNEITFGQFRAMISSVSSFLLSMESLKRQDRVCLLIKSSPEALAAIYGISQAAMTVVILDSEKTPLERCRVILDDSKASIVVVDDEFKDVFIELSDETKGWTVFTLSELLTCDSSKQITVNCDLQEQDVFGIYYTSGTTGVPKGVVITHSNVENLLHWWKGFFELKPSDRILLFSSLSFIMSLRQFIPTLHVGATVVIPKTALDFESAILFGKVNKLVCTPSALAALDHNLVAGCIEAVQVAGEAPQKSVLDIWKSSGTEVYIGLGPTELCAHALCSEYDGIIVCIGHPAANVKAYIVDTCSSLQCPVNCIGELWIAGKNVSGGYWNKAELSDKSFVVDPFSDCSMRLYKTGDLARRLPCGRIQFIGRSDSQLKVNGFRLEAGEILNAMPSYISRAHVLVQNNVLTMFVTPRSVDANDLKSYLSKQQLPSYMIPTIIHPIDEFPLNKNGKLDIPKLLSIVDSMQMTENFPDKEVETSQTEKTLILIWSQTLKRNASLISVDDNFFSLGGTSLSAVVVSRLISSNMQVDISVHDVFLHQSIKAMSEYIKCKRKNTEESTSDPHPLVFLPGGRNALHPLLFSFLQLIGLVIMSIIATVPIIATISISVRSFIWFGDLGVVLFPLFVCGGCLVHILLVAIIKWAVIGRYKVGKAKMFSFYFLKWWLVRRVMQVTQLYTWIFDETKVSRIFLQLLGATIGQNVSVEQPFLFEPDLVEVGRNCIIEFETVFATSEIRNGQLELRKVLIGDNVKIGVRSVLLGGAHVHSNCKTEAKTTVDYYTSTTEEGQTLIGSPAVCQPLQTKSLRPCNKLQNWRPARSAFFLIGQMVSVLVMIELMTGTVYVSAALIGRSVNQNFGSIGLVVYLGSAFQIISCIIWLLLVALLKRSLIPWLEEGKVYSSSWFALRKWILDRMMLSPLFSYASHRVLQTSSTFPWYMKLLGSTVGRKAWINHPYLRVGAEFINIGDEFHMGMLAYISSENHDSEGISFSRIDIGNHSSFGQRCVALGGASIGDCVTIGAETVLPFGFSAAPGATAFGSPPVLFNSTADDREIIEQSQLYAESMHMIDSSHSMHNVDNAVFGTKESMVTQEQEISDNTDANVNAAPSRMQDIGSGKYFWIYIITMILIQGCLPLIIGAAYGSIYYCLTLWLGDMRIEFLLASVPIIYIMGSFVLMLCMKLMQLIGGSFSIGTADFFSFRFFYWHVFADMVYLCTSTIIYPFSGTQIYCFWLRFMGAKIGKNVFISPENGGFREIDFMTIGNDCCLLTPNIHAHYTDHGKLQFCPVVLEDGCEINPGATIMPLTMYKKNSRLRPYAVTVKGQHCKEDTEYVGNPCKAITAPIGKVAILFSGQGSQYPGMLEQFSGQNAAQDLLRIASRTLEMNIEDICSVSANAEAMQDTRVAQPIVFVADLMAAEMMRQKFPIEFSKTVAVAGFSLGELAALCFAGAISFTQALHLVKVRAEAMGSCGDGAMCNLKGLSQMDTKLLAKKYGCKIANIICDHGEDFDKNVYVVAGSSMCIDKLISHVNNDVEAGIGPKAKKLRVSAAFHTEMMKEAQLKFQQALDSISITFPTDFLVYSNITGQPYTSAAEIRNLLPLQIVSTVQWHATLTDMVQNEDIQQFIECGPMDTLSKTVSMVLPFIPNEHILTSDEGQQGR